MDQEEVKKEIDNAQLSLELRLNEKFNSRIREAEAETQKVAASLSTMKQLSLVMAALAVIFGVSGAWGYKLLNDARQQLVELTESVGTLSIQVKDWETIKNVHTNDIHAAGKEALATHKSQIDQITKNSIEQFNKEINVRLKSRIENTVFAKITARSIAVENLSGVEVVRLSRSSDQGGLITIKSPQGGTALQAFATGTSAKITVRDPKTDIRLASFGSSDQGNGAAWFYNSKGVEGALIGAAGDDGVIKLSNSDTKNRIAVIGGTSKGNGGLWVYDKSGDLIGQHKPIGQ